MNELGGLRVADILGLEIMAQVRHVAGAGLDRRVRWVHTWPEVLPWLHGGELLLTTGYSWPAEVAQQRRIVRDLHRTGVAAILFRAGRPFFPAIPTAIKQEANRCGLPLLETREDLSFVDLTETLNREIIRSQVELLERSDRIHRTLTEAALEADSVADIAARLGELIGKEVLVVDWRLRALTPVSAAWERVRRLSGLTSRLANTSIHGWGPVRLDDETGVVAFPIRTGREVAAYLVILSPQGAVGDLDIRAGEHAAVVVGLHLLRQQAVADAEIRVRHTFVDAVLRGRLDDEGGLRERAQMFGFDPEGTYAVVIAVPVAADGRARADALTSTDDFQVRARLAHAVKAALEVCRLPVFVAFELNQVLCLVPADVPRRALRHRIDGLWRHLRRSEPDLAAAMLVGLPQRGHRRIAESLRQAQAAMAAVHGPGLWWYEDLTVLRILSTSGDRAAMAELYASTLGVLRNRAPALHETAAALAACAFNQREAARRLGVHWNTMRHRMARIEEVLGLHLDDPQVRFRLHLALEIERIAGRTA